MTDLRDLPDLRVRPLAPPTPPQPLRPFRYPIWVILSAVAVIAAAAYSAMSLPIYFPAARNLAEAKRSDARGDHVGAVALYRAVLAVSPQSEKARIGLAKALFETGGTQNDAEAFSLLVGVKLDKSDWEELKAVMPPEYQARFQETKS
jgi:hypothetical protein